MSSNVMEKYAACHAALQRNAEEVRQVMADLPPIAFCSGVLTLVSNAMWDALDLSPTGALLSLHASVCL